jgi:hypothetical protein
MMAAQDSEACRNDARELAKEIYVHWAAAWQRRRKCRSR